MDAPQTLAAMGAAARALGRPDAAARVADLLLGSGGARA
jgi:UDP-N-acetylglucosamine:LPS N-acetylglucosamine transferase